MKAELQQISSSYEIIPPTKFLKPYIRSFKFMEGFDCFKNKKVFPITTGYPELVIHYQDSGLQTYDCDDSNRIYRNNYLVNCYALHKPKRMEIDRPLKIMIISLYNHSLWNFFHLPLHETPSYIINLTDVLGDRLKPVLDGVSNARSNADRVQHMERFLNACLMKHSSKLKTGMIYSIMNYINHLSGHQHIEDVYCTFGISRRKLERSFQYHQGLTPKEFIRIVRFNKACELMTSFPVDWQELIFRCGYYDQAHFIHEFKQIMKSSPSHYLKQTQGIFYFGRAFLF